MKIGIVTGIAAIACSMAFAQKEDNKVFFFANGDTNKMHAEIMADGIVSARFGMMGPTVKGAPYAADGVTETTQTLGDGTHINRQETYSIYRDGEGRVRRESGSQTWISDPVANVSYVLNNKLQTARKLNLSHTVTFNKTTQDSAVNAKLKAEAKAVDMVRLEVGPTTGLAMIKADDAKSESLGKQSMEGVEVDGTRMTTIIPQGQIGNDRPLQTVHERWESADLHVTILAKHSDPMVGDRIERLTNVRRGEPDPALFQVPANYTIESEK